MVNFWADQGATSFKAYMNITRDELRAAVEEAHKRGLKVTGHLCSIGFREAAEIGIDNLEHGLLPDSEFVANKQPDKCPGAAVNASLRTLDINGDAVKETIRTLVAKKVALTSTLPVFEASSPLASTQAGPTAIGAPSALDKGSAKTRATKSAAPPGAKPTTSLTGREGYDCASAWLAKRKTRTKLLTTAPNPERTTRLPVSAGSTRGRP